MTTWSSPRIECALLLAMGLLLAAPLVVLATPSPQDEALKREPGFVDLDALGIFAPEAASLEIYIREPLISLVASAVREDDSELAQLLAALKAVRVQSFPLSKVDGERARRRSVELVRGLEKKGWQSIVRVREEDQEIYIYLREINQTIAGMMLVAIELGDSLTFVNIVGNFDPAQLGRLGRSLNIDPLEMLGEVTKKEGKQGAEQSEGEP